jgi:hypothetical protein
MSLTLPEPISAYFIADAANPDAVAACFTPDANVIDERQTHQGRDAIARWKQEASARYNYTAEPISISAQGSEQIVIAHLTGDFPAARSTCAMPSRWIGAPSLVWRSPHELRSGPEGEARTGHRRHEGRG